MFFFINLNKINLVKENEQENNNNNNNNPQNKNIVQNSNNINNLILENNNSNNVNQQTKKKSDRIIEILMKIKACEDTSSILTKIYGDNLIDKIISPDLEENLLNEIEKTIIEIQSYKQNNVLPVSNKTDPNTNNKINNNKNKMNNNNYFNYEFENDNFSERNENNNNINIQSRNEFPMRKIQNYNSLHNRQASNISSSRNNDIENLILERNYSTKNNNTISNRGGMRRSNSKSTLNVSRNSKSRSKSKIDFFEEVNGGAEIKFEEMLRKYGGRQMDARVFMNYFKNRGGFFDPTLQKGGNSSLDIKDQHRKRSNSRKKGTNNSISISYSNIQV